MMVVALGKILATFMGRLISRRSVIKPSTPLHHRSGKSLTAPAAMYNPCSCGWIT
jgi:hypothetical protein